MYTKYTGVILKKHPLGEADELLTIYTKQGGKLRACARGSRKIKSRLSGHLQSLNEIEFETAGSARGGLPVLISVRIISLNNYLREDLKKFATALVGIETLYRLTGDGQENREVYEELSRFLRELGEAEGSGRSLLHRFQLQLLRILGFGPDPKVQSDQELMRYVEEVLEREIRAKKFAKSLEIPND